MPKPANTHTALGPEHAGRHDQHVKEPVHARRPTKSQEEVPGYRVPTGRLCGRGNQIQCTVPEGRVRQTGLAGPEGPGRSSSSRKRPALAGPEGPGLAMMCPRRAGQWVHHWRHKLETKQCFLVAKQCFLSL